MKKFILAVIGLVIVGGIGLFGYNYYTNVYQSQTAYAVVPETPKKTVTKDDSGKRIKDSNGRQEYSYEYSFNWVTTDDQRRTVDFEQSGVNPKPLTPGSYVKAEVSKTRVTKGPFSVAAKNVPNSIKDQLK